MTESTHEYVEAVIRGKAHRDWVNVLLIVFVMALLGWITWDHAREPVGRGLTSLNCVPDGTGSTYWVVTFTDGATAPVAGPCRVAPTIP